MYIAPFDDGRRAPPYRGLFLPRGPVRSTSAFSDGGWRLHKGACFHREGDSDLSGGGSGNRQ